MQRKKEMINKVLSLSTRAIYDRAETETSPGDSRYTMLFVKKKVKKRKFSDSN